MVCGGSRWILRVVWRVQVDIEGDMWGVEVDIEGGMEGPGGY